MGYSSEQENENIKSEHQEEDAPFMDQDAELKKAQIR